VRCDGDRGARHGSADLRCGEWPVDGGVDRVFGAAQRPVNSDCRGAAEPAGSGLDSGGESQGSDVGSDRVMVEEVAGLKEKGGVEVHRPPCEVTVEGRGDVREVAGTGIPAIVPAAAPSWAGTFRFRRTGCPPTDPLSRRERSKMRSTRAWPGITPAGSVSAGNCRAGGVGRSHLPSGPMPSTITQP